MVFVATGNSSQSQKGEKRQALTLRTQHRPQPDPGAGRQLLLAWLSNDRGIPIPPPDRASEFGKLLCGV